MLIVKKCGLFNEKTMLNNLAKISVKQALLYNLAFLQNNNHQ